MPIRWAPADEALRYLGKTMILQLLLVQASEQAKAEERRRGIVKGPRPATADLVSCPVGI